MSMDGARSSHKLFDLHVPLEGTSYLRHFSGEVDCLTEDELRVRGRMRDHRFDLEHEWLLRTPTQDSPTYQILEARARYLAGEGERFSPDLCRAYQGLAGVPVGRGFTSRVLHQLGHAPGNREHLLLAIEMARAGQQVYQVPSPLEAQVRATLGPSVPLPLLSWSKDRAYMQELANSCYTYRDASEETFREGGVRCGFDPTVSRAQPGTDRVFWRTKRLTITTDPDAGPTGRYHCENWMEDRVHDIRVAFDLLPDGTIRHAQSTGERLPYHGLCEKPHQRMAGLEGLRVTAAFVSQFAEQIGGAQGCTHLFDLSIDCLRLIDFHS
jgi:hypothetical protein